MHKYEAGSVEFLHIYIFDSSRFFFKLWSFCNAIRRASERWIEGLNKRARTMQNWR